ncbi:anaerobic C4-dicarboxylate transporter DcuC [Yersinia mollaretii]|uniref:Anaerobic C4-dicarboxylate transporter dcuC n=1 Tax=Yersinia mollaretii (strain ATCC 43969 / DSM 18520 / CIP 103324 / CNY 7263 / WAIP 204) TaxID=349967 RepID=A0ABM9YE75_YERMW|nr:anaerobic C4-dicarboxylate transporter DcuC [Yersinia mollaretii]EEQ12296.1 Anaerobic C4-dicarboxylate transporter dcuC [Yersinia mollaretii ATCC 43969]MDN0110604.1 anaerobic C4-dicarboxylate transporter DcuC [Yersinia mollaretii]PJE86896.1 anaerobic C4-dicarboxylate transporter DcuC [Yersinia mollaretii]QKJ03819.1 anaerobic C4-dicarboxylate transporter DcuC [Yersinia mollaretii ATCC 43969]CQD33002.1 C4-dicarboxylate transporter DcuC [Yersinia mollaretii]
MLDLLIGVVVAIGVGRYIIKGYSATGVLMVGGLLLLIISALMGKNVLPASATSTGWRATDIVEYVKILLMSRGGDLGMMIMMLCGFAAYMTHIGANDVVVKIASKPLQMINSPYLLMVAAYIVACLMSLAVSSATGLGVLLMATLFPVMVNVGISRGAAAAICASPAAIILAPTSGDVVLAAKASEMPLVDFAFKTTLPISIAAIVCMAIAHFFWQRYLDNKSQEKHEMMDVNEITTNAPAFYAILPFTPIIGVLIFDGKWGPELHIITVLVICMLAAAVIEFIRSFSAKTVFTGLEVAYRGMADAFATVVMLLVAAGVFAQGLSTVGFISGLIGLAQSFGTGGIIMMLVLVTITMLAAMTTGSGNAPFYAFVELIPKLAAQMGINPAYLVIPMLQASNLGRTLSPVSGVVVAVAGMAKISPFEVVKRTSVPVLVGLVVVIVATEILVPVHL